MRHPKRARKETHGTKLLHVPRNTVRLPTMDAFKVTWPHRLPCKN